MSFWSGIGLGSWVEGGSLAFSSSLSAGGDLASALDFLFEEACLCLADGFSWSSGLGCEDLTDPVAGV